MKTLAPSLPPPLSLTSRHTFLALSALLFLTSSALTITWCVSMSDMGDMPMPGSWSMSMMWMLMPGQTWLSAAATFIGMWSLMMVAMMLPSLTPLLWRYHQSLQGVGINISNARRATLTTIVALAYFLVWTILGALLYPVGLTLAELTMESAALSRTIPTLSSLLILLAGILQFTHWKNRHLTCCRAHPSCIPSLPANPITAWRHGLRLGLHCNACCAPHTILLLILGAMDLRAMALITTAITLERLTPSGPKIAHTFGALTLLTGLLLLIKASL